MPSLTQQVEFECRCSECRGELSVEVSTDYRGNHVVSVAPCEGCLRAARDAGYEEGLHDSE